MRPKIDTVHAKTNRERRGSVRREQEEEENKNDLEYRGVALIRSFPADSGTEA
jgi:hypothetical protein